MSQRCLEKELMSVTAHLMTPQKTRFCRTRACNLLSEHATNHVWTWEVDDAEMGLKYQAFVVLVVCASTEQR